VDLLLEAVGGLRSSELQLVVIGGGGLEENLKIQAQTISAATTILWRGVVPQIEIREEMKKLDVLVLPSDYDGWGAVVSEAMTVGVPVICSDACGSSAAVRKAPYGAVFERGSVASLQSKLAQMIARGPLEMEARTELAAWARCLNASSGARYLERIVHHLSEPSSQRPAIPWETFTEV
jgi:glycosyltransferase involved in cell wall biosynthesis